MRLRYGRLSVLQVLCFGISTMAVTGIVAKTLPGLRLFQASMAFANTKTAASFSSKSMWPTGLHAYKRGLSTVSTPPAPIAYESAGITEGAVNTISLQVSAEANGISRNAYGFYEVTKTIKFPRGTINIDGSTYTVPVQDENDDLYVLPLQRGIVWTALTSHQPEMSVVRGDKIRANPKAVKGKEFVYYTPYHVNGGSLSVGATEIASVPNDWEGDASAALTTAWSSWIPGEDIQPPKVISSSVYQLDFANEQENTVKIARSVKVSAKSWPELYAIHIPRKAKNESPAIARIMGLTRTARGMIMDVHVVIPDGSNYFVDAMYYWSESTRKWTPLAQLDSVQTLPAFASVGSQAVYWQQPLGLDGNRFGVAQLHYNPMNNTLNSVWLGNWVFGESYVDGKSWINVLASDEPSGSKSKPKKWTVYTP